MRTQILDRLHALESEIKTTELWLNAILRRAQTQNDFDAQYIKQVVDWASQWHSNFYRDILHAKETRSAIKSIRERKSLELRAYFNLRYVFLPFCIADFTAMPFYSVHDLLQKMAHCIVEKDESACQIMMPWVERVVGYAPENDIKAATESPEGDFCEYEFVTAGADRRTLISVMDYLHYVRVSTDIAKNFFDSDHPAILGKKFGIPLRNYVRALEYRYRQSTMNKNCFAYHAHHLAMSLHERSKNRQGTERAASAKYENVIADFYAMWKSLPAATRKAIDCLKISNTEKCNFEDYLLVIFASVPAVQTNLSVEDLKRELGLTH